MLTLMAEKWNYTSAGMSFPSGHGSARVCLKRHPNGCSQIHTLPRGDDVELPLENTEFCPVMICISHTIRHDGSRRLWSNGEADLDRDVMFSIDLPHSVDLLALGSIFNPN